MVTIPAKNILRPFAFKDIQFFPAPMPIINLNL